VNEALRPDSFFTVFAYTMPRINDGSDWIIGETETMKKKGFEVIDGS
jgi:hypothetical protein